MAERSSRQRGKKITAERYKIWQRGPHGRPLCPARRLRRPVYLSAILKYHDAEVLELVGNAAMKADELERMFTEHKRVC